MSEGVASVDELSDDEPMNRAAMPAGPPPVVRIPGRRRAEPLSPAGTVGSIGAVGQGWTYRPVAVPATFARTPWGHRGYDEAGVDAFADQVAKDLAAAEAEIGDLRAEVDRLHTYIRRQWAAVAAAEAAGDRSAGRPGELVSPTAQARAVLTQAQEIAERRLAEADDRLAEAAQRLSRADVLAEQVLAEARAEADGRRARAADDARRLLLGARSRYEDIVVRAHQRADRAAELAVGELEDHDVTRDSGTGRARAELEVKAAYLRTFAKVSRAALQAALDVTAREFDRLLGASASIEVDEGAPVQPSGLPQLSG